MATIISGDTDVSQIQDGTVSSSAKIAAGVVGQGDLTTSVIPVGAGQTWQTFAIGTTRVNGTPYTNTTGRPIQLSIVFTNTSSVSLIIDGVTIVTATTGSYVFGVTPVIPSGSVYTVLGAYAWAELR